MKGYFQQFEVDFGQIFTAIVKPIVFHILFAIAAFYNLNIYQIDVKIAFYMVLSIS